LRYAPWNLSDAASHRKYISYLILFDSKKLIAIVAPCCRSASRFGWQIVHSAAVICGFQTLNELRGRFPGPPKIEMPGSDGGRAFCLYFLIAVSEKIVGQLSGGGSV
jgi:hypothetical protein